METETRTQKPAKRSGSRPYAVIVGTLLIPISALAAYAFVTPETEPNDPVPATATADSLFRASLTSNPDTATPEDLALACGESGLELVAAEEGGTITDVQQAALDALRDICEQQGMPLPGKLAPDPIVKQVIVRASSTSPTATTAGAASDKSGYGDDSEYEGESEYEDGYEDEDEYEDESEEEHHEHEDDEEHESGGDD